MELQHGHERYWTIPYADNEAGCAGLELVRERFGKSATVARLLFWDAAGEFAVETLGCEVPLPVIEAAVVAVRQHIRFR
jgi:hypothetical protein